MQDLELSAYLTSKGIQVWRANGAEITAHCWFCPDGDPKGRGKLYLNTESWLWDCKRCGTAGNRKTLLRHFGDQDNVEYLPGQDPTKIRAVLEDAAALAHEMLLGNDEMLEYLVGRGLSAHTITSAQFGYVPRSWSLSGSLRDKHDAKDLIAAGVLTPTGKDFFQGKLTIPYLQRGSVVQLRAKDKDAKYFTPTGQPVRLYNSDSLGGATDVVVTEGEYDCKILEQTLLLSPDANVRSYGVVGVPGAGSFPKGFENYFTEAKRVWIAFDPDEAGKRGSIKLKQLIGSKARIVQLPEQLPKCDWTEYLRRKDDRHPHGGHGLDDVLDLLASASGRRLWTVADAGAKFRRRRSEIPGIKMGFQDLDKEYKPGLEPGDLVIPLARTGTGKSNLLNTLAYNTRSHPTLYVSLEMTATQVYERLARIARFHQPFITDHQIAEEFSMLRIVDENRLTEGDISALCEEFDEEVGVRPHLVFVDYLGYYARGIRGSSSYEKTTNAAMSLKGEAKANEVAMVVPSQVSRQAQAGRPLSMEDARDSGAIEACADLLIGLYRPEEAIDQPEGAQQSGAVRVGVLKNRKGLTGVTASLLFSLASLVLVDAKDDRLARKVREENHMVWRGADYDVIRASYGTQQLKLVK